MYGREFHEWQQSQRVQRDEDAMREAAIHLCESRASAHVEDAKHLLTLARQNSDCAAQLRAGKRLREWDRD